MAKKSGDKPDIQEPGVASGDNALAADKEPQTAPDGTTPSADPTQDVTRSSAADTKLDPTKDPEGFDQTKVDKPSDKVTVDANPGAQISTDSHEPKHVNVVPEVKGAVLPTRGGPIASTEGRSSNLDDHVLRKADGANPETGYPDNVVAQPQEPDPLVLGGRAWDAMRGAKTGDIAPAASNDPGLGAQPVEPNGLSESGKPNRPTNAPATSLLPTLRPGASPQAGAPVGRTVVSVGVVSDALSARIHVAGSAARLESIKAVQRGKAALGHREGDPRIDGRVAERSNIVAQNRAATAQSRLEPSDGRRAILPQRPVHDAALQEVHESVASRQGLGTTGVEGQLL